MFIVATPFSRFFKIGQTKKIDEERNTCSPKTKRGPVKQE